jgi:hypothetical protein
MCGLAFENRTKRSGGDFAAMLGECVGDVATALDRKQVSPEEAEAERQFRLAQLRAGCINSIRSYLNIHTDCTTAEEAATANLEVCLVPCDQFSGTCCQRIEGTCSTKYPRWIEVICEGQCKRFGYQNSV